MPLLTGTVFTRILGRLFAPLAAPGVAFVLALAVVLASAPATVKANEDDEGVIVRLVQTLLSDAGREVRIRGFQGALSSRATMESLTIADDEGVWLRLHNVVLDWNRSALINRRVEVNELSADEIQMLRLPSTEDDGALPSPTARPEFRLPELPVSVNIGVLRARRVVLEAPVTGQQAEFAFEGGMALAGGQGEGSFIARRTDGQEGHFIFRGDFDNLSRHLALELDLSEGAEGIAASLLDIPGRPALALTVEGAGPLSSFAADIVLATDGNERVTGTVTVGGDMQDGALEEGTRVALDIAGDLRPLLSAELHPFFGSESRLRAQLERSEDGAISLTELTFNTRTLRLAGRAELGSDGLPRVVDLIADIARDDGEAVVLPGTGGQVRLREAALNIEFDASVSRNWQVLGRIDSLSTDDLLLTTIDLEANGRLLAALSGGPETAPLFDGVFDFAVQGIEARDPAMQSALGSEISGFMSLIWPGPERPIEITGIAVEGQTAALTAHGFLDGARFTGFAEAELHDLAAFSGLAGRDLRGHTLLQSQGSVNFVTGAFDQALRLAARDLAVDQPEFDRLVAGRSSLEVNIARSEEGTVLRDLSLAAGAMTLQARGQHLPEDIFVELQFDSADLTALGPGYGGRITLEARLDSDGERQQLRAIAQAQDLQPGDLPGAAALRGLLRGETRLGLGLAMEGERITIEEARVEGQQLEASLTGHWEGTSGDLALDLMRLELAGIAPSSAGRLAGDARVRTTPQAHHLDLALASDGRVVTGIPEIDGLLLNGLRLATSVTAPQAGGLSIEQAQLQAPGLGITLSGRQEADGTADFALRGQIDNVARALAGIDGAAGLEAQLTRARDETHYDTRFSLNGPSGLALSGSGRIAEDLTLALRATGQVDAAIANPRIEPFSVQGAIAFDARIDGPPQLQSLRASAQLAGGRFVAPNDGFAFEDIIASAEVMGPFARVQVDGAALRGGRGSLEGTITLDRRRDADLTVRTDRLRVVRPGLFETEISGQARLLGSLALGPRLSGSVTVNEAEIRIPNSPLGRAGYIPEGLRHVGESAASRRTRIHAGIDAASRTRPRATPITLDLELQAPGRVFVRGRGLDAELGGTLRLGGTTRDIIPSGSFTLIRGQLDLLGNRFQLTDGSASMIGSFMPFVRLVATTDSGGVVTSVVLEGAADEPEIRFTSVPELPEDEVLARLIFRRSLTTLSPFQAAQLALSVATLTGHAEGSFLTRTRQSLGLDDLDVTTDADGNTALRAGRYLSENIYTDLSVDSAGRGSVSINLDLSPSIRLRGRTDTEGRSGVGVFFERDY